MFIVSENEKLNIFTLETNGQLLLTKMTIILTHWLMNFLSILHLLRLYATDYNIFRLDV